MANWAYSPAPTVNADGSLSGGIQKFVDSLPGLTSAGANDLGEYLPVAIPDQFSYPGSDYYEIAVVQYTEQMSKDLAPTTLRGYVQIETPVNATFTDSSGNLVSKHIPLSYPDGSPIRDHNGNQVYAFDKPSYLGPEIVAERNVPVRVKYDNYLPTGDDGDLFLPVDTTVQGSGAGPIQSVPTGPGGILLNGRYLTISLTDPLTNTSVGENAELSGFTPTEFNGGFPITAMTSDLKTITVDLGQSFGTDVPHFHPDPAIPNDPLMSMVAQAYTQNRMAPHLHGGDTVWISDGDLNQWITPEGEQTAYPQGVSVHDVPDMPDPGDGSMTFFYSNDQSARLMFVHDHAAGITRLNVYAGEAMGYLLTDQVEQDLINQGVLPDLGTPLIIQDKTFIDPKTVLTTDPTWPLPVDQSGSTSNLWTPHVYIPNQNPNGPDGTNPTGRWDYGPFFWPPWPTTEAPIQGVGNIQVQDGGSNYTKPPIVTFVPYAGDTTGSGATATAVISGGVLTDIQVATAGSSYSAPPVVTITNAPGDTTGASGGGRAILDANGAVIGFTILNPGTGYTLPPIVTITPAPADHPDSTATATATISGGVVTGITIVNFGSGYASPPTVVITPAPGDTTGNGATASAEAWLYPNVPNDSMTTESYQDTPVVNGTAYPYMDVQPQAYRFQVLDASDDRMWNLQLYTSSSILSTITLTSAGSGYTQPPMITITPAPGDTTGMGATAVTQIDPRTGSITGINIVTVGSGYTLPPIVTISPPPPGGTPATAVATIYTGQSEVGMVPAIPGAANFPQSWTVQTIGQPGDILDGRYGGVPDPRTIGPDIIQIGNDGGFLPTPVDLKSTPIGYERNPKNIVIGSVSQKELLLGPAERADVIIDFSQFAGKTVILYNDSPAPVPATDSRLDYFTDDLNQTSTGGTVSTHAGYGPNTRTIMVFHVAATTPHPYDVQKLMDAFTTTSTHQGVFEQDQNPIIVPQAAYDSAYNANFSSGTDAYARIQSTSLTFRPLDLSQPTKVSPTSVTVDFQPKTIQELFDNDTGRMEAFLGVELPFTNGGNQTTIPYTYNDPVTEIIDDTTNVQMTKIGDLGDGTQIWKITHNGVDTHPVHFHLFDVQVIDRVGWDGMVKPPDPNELGWMDTVRMNPLEDIIVALRPTAPAIPFGVPDSIRPLNPDMPLGTTWRTFDPTTGNPITVTNTIYNFGWEYMWHCHILSHEEMSMMRPIQFNVPVSPPDPAIAWESRKSGGVDIQWIDPTPVGDPNTPGNPKNEIGWRVKRAPASSPTAFASIADLPANTTTYVDSTADPNTAYVYQVTAYNASNHDASTNVIVPLTSVSTSMKGDHGAGETIPIMITFNKPVNVTGLPELALNFTGTGPTAKAIYSGGTGTATLTFLYQVVLGQSAAPLDYTSTNALTLPNGATIAFKDNSGYPNLTLPDQGTNSDGLFAQDITIEPKTVPVVYWPTPANIVYGAALGAGQLNATVTFNHVTVAGSKDYKVDPGTGVEPAMGVVLHPGTYPLTMHFTPTDYMAVDATQSITVLKAAPTFVVSEPPSIVYGSPWLNITGQLKAPYPLVMPGGDTVSISIGLDSFTATTTAGGNFTYTLDTSHMPASATPYTIAYAYAGNSDLQSASDITTTLTVSDLDLGFEQPAVGTGAFEYNPTGSPWTFSGGSGISGNNSGFTSGNPPAPQGVQVAFLQGTGSFTQSVTGWAAGSYVLTFDAAKRGNFGVSQQDFEVLIDNKVVDTFTPSSTSYQSYSTVAFTVTAGAHTITFQGMDSAGGDNTAFLDQVAVALASPSSIGDPGFEQVVVGSSQFQYGPTGSPWGFTGSSGISGNNSGFTSGNPPAPQGAQVAFLQGDGSFTQNVNWATDGSHVLTFDAAQRGNFGGSEDFKVLIDDSVVGTFTPSSKFYQSYSTVALIVSPGAHKITFQGLDSATGDNTAFIDAVSIS